MEWARCEITSMFENQLISKTSFTEISKMLESYLMNVSKDCAAEHAAVGLKDKYCDFEFSCTQLKMAGSQLID